VEARIVHPLGDAVGDHVLGPGEVQRDAVVLERAGQVFERLQACGVDVRHRLGVQDERRRDGRRGRTRICLSPLREQRRLAVPGGCDHGREGRRRRAQPPDRVRLRHGAGPGRRARQLDLYEVERNFGELDREASLRGQPDVWPLLERVSYQRHDEVPPAQAYARAARQP
jgi:hypothetical protein